MGCIGSVTSLLLEEAGGHEVATSAADCSPFSSAWSCSSWLERQLELVGIELLWGALEQLLCVREKLGLGSEETGRL